VTGDGRMRRFIKSFLDRSDSRIHMITSAAPSRQLLLLHHQHLF
jgi:hypothetical protein